VGRRGRDGGSDEGSDDSYLVATLQPERPPKPERSGLLTGMPVARVCCCDGSRDRLRLLPGVWLAHKPMFFADEWEFLAGRGFNLHDLLRAHYGQLGSRSRSSLPACSELADLRAMSRYVMVTIVIALVAAADRFASSCFGPGFGVDRGDGRVRVFGVGRAGKI